MLVSMTPDLGIYSIVSSLCVMLAINKHLKVECMSNVEVEGHLELGKQLLTKGQYADALSHFHAAVEGDPQNYLTYFKRATVYLALGKSKPAIEDLDEVIALKPDFLAARLQRGQILLKQGRLDEAHIDFEWVLRLDPSNMEAHQAYVNIEPIQRDIALAYNMVEDRNFVGAIEILTNILKVCPWDSSLWELRATCYENIGHISLAINDLRPTLRMTPDNTKGYLKLSKLYYQLADVDESLNTIRECLKLDPDHKDCFSHYKKVKKLAATLRSMQDLTNESQYADCVQKGKAALRQEPDIINLVHLVKSRMCHCHSKGGEFEDAINICTDALKLSADDVNVLCDRAEAYLNNEHWDQAYQDFERASNIDPNSQRAQDGLKKAQRLQKMSSKRDYYKILGVKRTATKKEILKAYRKLAQKWHPDNFQGDSKKDAEKKFIDIASAKEVLTDPEKRQKFDNGEDPLDPESQQGQGFNPFAHGFQSFGNGGPFTFKFVFN